MIRKPTKSEAICLVIGLTLTLLIWLLIPKSKTEKTPVTVLVPYDSTRQRLVVKADSSENKLVIFQERTHQSHHTYEKQRIRYDSIIVQLP